jgi:hypothetical protein
MPQLNRTKKPQLNRKKKALNGVNIERGKHLTRQILVWSLDARISGYGGQLVKILEG